MSTNKRKRNDVPDDNADYLYRCTSCGDTNINNVTSVQTSDCFNGLTFYCNFCGCEYKHNPIPDWQYKKKYSGPVVPYGKLGSYNRLSHFNERLRCHMLREPIIENKNFSRIREAYERLVESGSIPSEPLKKSHVRQILRLIDDEDKKRENDEKSMEPVFASDEEEAEELYHLLKETVDDEEEPKKKKKKRGFSTKYLEKFKSIIYRLTEGRQELQYLTPEQRGCLGQLLKFFSVTWNRWKAEGLYPERKHFPNINLVLRRSFEEMDINHLDLDEFPIPADTTNLQVYVDALIKAAYKAGILIEN